MARKPIVIAEIEFPTKQAITEQCQKIVSDTGFGKVDAQHEQFLLELLGNHDEWAAKSSNGILGFEVDRAAEQHTKCFYITQPNGERLDISWVHALRCIDTGRLKMSSQLGSFKKGARTEIAGQIQAYRETRDDLDTDCPLTGVQLRTITSHVDHTPPATFDRILRDFCDTQSVDPIAVAIGSRNGTEAYFEEQDLASRWQDYH